MRKYVLLFCFLTILLFSNEITKEQFDQYYDYAVLIFRGLSGKNETTEQKCANYLVEEKDSLSPLFKELIEKFQNNTITLLDLLTKYYLPLAPVNDLCNIITLAGLYMNFLNDYENYINKTLKEIGQSLTNIIDFSVE